MDKVIDYIVLRDEYAESLTEKVKKLLPEWQPMGPASCSNAVDVQGSQYFLYTQTMVKYAPGGEGTT